MSHDSAALREEMIRQMVYFDEQRMLFLDTHFPIRGVKSQERTLVEQRINEYVSMLRELIGGMPSDGMYELERVIVGSQVTVQYEGETDTEVVRLCFPERIDPDQGMISFLSPMGLQLLGASLNDTITFSMPPAEEIRVKIVGVNGVKI